MEELKYLITDQCPADLIQNWEIEKWRRFLEACHLDYTIQYIIANDDLREWTTVRPDNQSLKDCPEIDFILPQIDAKVRFKRISDETLNKVDLIEK